MNKELSKKKKIKKGRGYKGQIVNKGLLNVNLKKSEKLLVFLLNILEM